MKKKIFALVLAGLTAMCVFAGCGEETTTSETESTASETSSVTESVASEVLTPDTTSAESESTEVVDEAFFEEEIVE